MRLSPPLIILAFTVFVIGIFLARYQIGRSFPPPPPTSSTAPTTPKTHPPEIIAIKEISDLKAQVASYKALIERVGVEEAQEALLDSGLPFDGQAHLLNHTVGDWLYVREGASGLGKCKDYFLSSCYHGFVIHAVGDGGVASLVGVMEQCWIKGGHVAIQCSHAIGHGFLAWVGYANLPRSLVLCDELASSSQTFPTYNCYDGAFMENIWAVHEDGKPAPDRWVRETDDYYPCDDSRIDLKYIKGCWSNQPSLLYQRFGGDLSKVASVCQTVQDKEHQETCFDGLARQIHPLTKGSIEETFRMCGLLPKPWDEACLTSNAKASFSVGDRELPFTICGRMSGSGQDWCWQDLIGSIRAYFPHAGATRNALCAKIGDPTLQGLCKD